MPSEDPNASRAGGVIACTVIGFVLTTLAVASRIFARQVRAGKLYLDDYLIVISWVFKTGIDIAGCLLLNLGLGRHISTVSPADMITFFKIQYCGAILYPFCVTFYKLSILVQYRRLFGGRFFHCAVNTIMVITVTWCISVSFTGVFICTPIDKAWYPLKEGNCVDLISFYYGLQIPNVVTDVAIIILPLKEVAELKLPKQQKFGVALACALWILCLLMGIARLVIMIGLKTKGNDVTWNLPPGAIWTTIEPTVAIITACLPAWRVLFRLVADHIHKSRQEFESQRLDSLSDSSALKNGQTLVELERTPPRNVVYDKSTQDKQASSHGDDSGTMHSPTSLMSPAIKYASSSTGV